ncbi:MAG: hypothetical protein ACLP74_08485 [Thermoplasmata archaeon]
MAMAAVPLVAEETSKAAEGVRERFDALGEDPALYLGNALRKWGSVFLIAGGGSWIIARAAGRMEQSYLNDINNRLGLPASSSPTAPKVPAAAAVTPPTPVIPPYLVALNDIVADVNELGTVSAAANVGLLQDALKQLWAIAQVVYAPKIIAPVDPTVGTGSPMPTQNPPPGLGTALCVGIMQTCLIIRQLEGQVAGTGGSLTFLGVTAHYQAGDWSWGNWQGANVYDSVLAPDGKLTRYQFLTAATEAALLPYALIPGGSVDWTDAINEVSQVSGAGGAFTYKGTINNVAAGLNASQPWDLTLPAPPNQWGILGTIALDLGGVGAAFDKAGATIVTDVTSFASDVSQFAGDVGKAVGFLGKVVLNLPFLIFDSLGYAASWAGHTILGDIAIPLMILGGGMIAVSYFLLRFWPRLRTRLELNANAGLAQLWNRFDKWNKSRRKIQQVWTQKSTEALIDSVNTAPTFVAAPLEVPAAPVETPPTNDAGPAAEPEKSEPEGAGGAGASTRSASPEGPATATAPTPTARTEEILGGVAEQPPEAPEPIPSPPDAPESPGGVGRASDKSEAEPTPAELEVQEANRVESAPEPPKARPGGRAAAQAAHAQFEGIAYVKLPRHVARLSPEEARAVAAQNDSTPRAEAFERLAESEEERQRLYYAPEKKRASMKRTEVMSV